MSLDIFPNVVHRRPLLDRVTRAWRWRWIRKLRARNEMLESRVASLNQQNQDLSDAAESMRRCLEMVTQQNIQAAAAMGFNHNKK